MGGTGTGGKIERTTGIPTSPPVDARVGLDENNKLVVDRVIVGVVLEGLLELAAGSVDSLVEELDVVDDLSEELGMADVAGAARFDGRL